MAKVSVCELFCVLVLHNENDHMGIWKPWHLIKKVKLYMMLWKLMNNILSFAMNVSQATPWSYYQVNWNPYWDKIQQTVVNETLIELSKHHLYQQANR